MTHLRRGDADLHHADGSHRSTAPSANGSAVLRWERRLAAHLAAHDEGPER
jgi:hypothetical protein